MVEWERFEVAGSTCPVTGTFLRHGGSRLGLALPGLMFGWQTPPVLYPVLALLDAGYDVLCLDSVYQGRPNPDVVIADARTVLAAARAAGPAGGPLLMGKSLGTAAMAGLLASGEVGPGERTVWLTPMLGHDAVFQQMRRLEAPGLVLIGTADPHHFPDRLAELRELGHLVVEVEGANHGLAVDGDAAASAAVPRLLVGAVAGYLGGNAQ